MKKLGVGIIGCGTIAPVHCHSISKIKDLKLIGVADIIKQKAKKISSQYGGVYYSDYRELLKREDIDIIHICTPHYLHSQMTIDAAEAGKHVLVEKPMAINLKQANEMLHKCNKADVNLSVISQHRFDENVKEMYNLVKSGKLGELLLGKASLKCYRSMDYYSKSKWRGKWATAGGGLLMNQLIHFIDIVRWIMGSPRSVYANIDTLRHEIEVEDTAVASIQFDNKSLASIEGTTASKMKWVFQLEMHGDGGSNILNNNGSFYWGSNSFNYKKGQLSLTNVSSKGREHYGIGHLYQILDFVESVKESRKPLLDGIEGKRTLELIMAMYKSSRKKKVVRL